jgi:hypothetical protein
MSHKQEFVDFNNEGTTMEFVSPENSFKQIMPIDHFTVAVIIINVNAESVQILVKMLTQKKQVSLNQLELELLYGT